MNSNGGWRKVAIQPMISLPVFIPQPAPGTYDPPPLIRSRMIRSEAHRGRIQGSPRRRHPLFLKLFYPRPCCTGEMLVSSFWLLNLSTKSYGATIQKKNLFHYIPVVLPLYGASPYLRIGHHRQYSPGFKGRSLIQFTLAPITLGPQDGLHISPFFFMLLNLTLVLKAARFRRRTLHVRSRAEPNSN